MPAFDTNVALRLLVCDDEVQAARAAAALERAVAAGGAWIGLVTLVEVSWVLGSAFRFPRREIAEALRRLVDTDGVVVEQPDLVETAIDRALAGPSGFADYVILEAAARAGVLPLLTFDKNLLASEGVESVP